MGFEKRTISRSPGNVAGVFAAIACLALLVGCQGFSSSTPVQPSSGSLSFETLALSFGSVAAGTSKTLNIAATNTGNAAITISSASVTTKYFALIAPALPITIAAGQSASLTVAFTPDAVGSFAANLAVSSDASNALTNVSLSGTATGTGAAGQLTVSPGTLNLGSVVVGTSATGSGTLTATGASVTVTAASTNNSVFSVGGLALPITIPAGSSTSFSITFSPLTSGAANGTLRVASDAQTSTTTQALTGSGS